MSVYCGISSIQATPVGIKDWHTGAGLNITMLRPGYGFDVTVCTGNCGTRARISEADFREVAHWILDDFPDRSPESEATK